MDIRQFLKRNNDDEKRAAKKRKMKVRMKMQNSQSSQQAQVQLSHLLLRNLRKKPRVGGSEKNGK